MAGSVLMLLAIIFMMRLTPEVTGGAMSASLLDFYKLNIPFVSGDFFTPQTLLFFAFVYKE
jgi:NADH-quinone oxidoreductase subunit M